MSVEDFFCQSPVSFQEMFSRNSLEVALLGDVQALACIVKKLSMKSALQSGNAGPKGDPGVGAQVVGGSGAAYNSIGAAINGEVATEIQFAPQAGTATGTITGAGTLSATDDFYKGWWVVNVDSTPTAGLVYRYARVTKYVGATKVLTIDEPWNFAAESNVTLVNPARITVFQNRTENVNVSKSVVINGAATLLDGEMNITAGVFHSISGLDIRDGLQSSVSSALIGRDLAARRRGDTVYAVLLDSTVNLGRASFYNCEFHGRVAGRRGFSGWEFVNCKNHGDPSVGVPYALVETLAGQSIAIAQFDIASDSEFSGSWFYSEGTITSSGGSTYLSAQGSLRTSMDYFGIAFPLRRFAVGRVRDAGTIVLTVNSGAFNIDLSTVNAEPDIFQTPSGMDIPNYGPTASLLALENASGVSSLTFSLPSSRSLLISTANNSHFSILSVEGTGTTSGSGTVAGTSGIFISARSRADVACPFTVMGTLTGSLTVSSAFGVSQGSVAMIYLLANQTAGAPTITFSGTTAFDRIVSLRFFQVATGVSVSVGTYLLSGSFIVASVVAVAISMPSTVSGGTWTVSSQLFIEFLDSSGNIAYSSSATGGTVTFSGLQFYVGGRINALRLASCIGAGGTIVNTGAITFENMAISQTNGILARATTATSTARCTGNVVFVGCTFETAMTMLTSSVAGSVAEGPSSLRFENCDFRSTWNDRGAADLGTFTWAVAILQWKNTHIEGLTVILGTSFATVEAIQTAFNGNSGEKSITITGTRPTVYRLWKCSFAARFGDLLPEVMNVYDVLPAAAALVQGQPLTINATQQAVVCVAASFLEGASMDAPAGAASRAIIVREGRLFLAVAGAVASGDPLTLDLVTPTQFATGAVPGQTGGRALEAAGTTVAGKAYSSVLVR